MAKNLQKTNALGMELTPETFGTKEAVSIPIPRPVPTKSLTKNVSFTLQEEAIEKLTRLAEEQDVSKSKFINRLIMSL